MSDELLVEDLGRRALPEAARPLTCPVPGLLWSTHAVADLAAGGLRLMLAPSGVHPATHTVVLPWGLVEEWGDPTPASLVGRRWHHRPHAPRPVPQLSPLPRLSSGPRPLLLAHSPPRRPWGARALEGASGSQLAAALGTTLSGMLASFDSANLLETADETPDRARRRLEESGVLEGRIVVIVGRETEHALRDGGRLELPGATVAAAIPHPSGRSPEWNVPSVVQQARVALVDALVAARAPIAGLQLVGRREEYARALADARAGRWEGWAVLADLGVAAHSAVPGHAWRPEPMEGEPRRVAWVRRWRGGQARVEPDEAGFIVHLEHRREDQPTPRLRVTIETGLLEAVALGEDFAACHGAREYAERRSP